MNATPRLAREGGAGRVPYCPLHIPHAGPPGGLPASVPAFKSIRMAATAYPELSTSPAPGDAGERYGASLRLSVAPMMDGID